MNTTSQQSKGRDGTPSTLNMAIEDMSLAGKISCITPAKAVFGSASFVLSMIRVSTFSAATRYEPTCHT